ncbi:MAG: thioredoxin [Myxococcales bacterium]|nr:thioredoxin [Myxococcales bacterium]
MSTVRPIGDADIEREIIHSDLPVLIDFFAEWCQPCKTMSPRLEKVAKDYGAALKVVKIDVDANPMAAQMFGIRAMPTFVIVKDRKVVDVAQGAMDASQLDAWVGRHVQKAKGPELWDAKRLKLAIEIGMAQPVDLRDPVDFARARVPSALNVSAAELSDRLAALGAAGVPLVFYDRTGTDAPAAAERAFAAGLAAGTLDGGMLGWEAAGNRVERG